MRIVRMGPAEVQRCWPWLSRLLAPAVALEDGARSLDDVRSLLVEGRAGLATLHHPGAAAVVVIEPMIVEGVYCLWLKYLAGEITGGPKVWLRVVRRAMARFEEKAREAGCQEIRIGGRDWSRVFPGWLPYPLVPNGLRKGL